MKFYLLTAVYLQFDLNTEMLASSLTMNDYLRELETQPKQFLYKENLCNK